MNGVNEASRTRVLARFKDEVRGVLAVVQMVRVESRVVGLSSKKKSMVKAAIQLSKIG